MADEEASKASAAGWKAARWFSVIYGLATAVGFSYASAYFGHFDIDILNYVAPIDLIFISLEHIDRVVLIALFVMPAAFLCLVIGTIVTYLCLVIGVIAVVLFVLSIVSAFANLVVTAVVVLGESMVFLGYGVVESVQVPAVRLFWLSEALSAVRADRVERAAQDEDATQGHGEPRRALSLADAYGYAKEQGPPKWRSDPGRIRTKATEIWNIERKTWERTVRAWRSALERSSDFMERTIRTVWRRFCGVVGRMCESYFGDTAAHGSEEEGKGGQGDSRKGRPRLLRIVLVGAFGALLLTILFIAALRVGSVDAAMIEYDRKCDFDILKRKFDVVCYGRAVFCPLVPSLSCELQDEPLPCEQGSETSGTVDAAASPSNTGAVGEGAGLSSATSTDRRWTSISAVPTANLASLEFSDCAGTGEGPRKYARPNFRQDAGNDARGSTPDCMVYLGATGSMQFLGRFKGDAEYPRKITESGHTFVVLYGGQSASTTPASPQDDDQGERDGGDDGDDQEQQDSDDQKEQALPLVVVLDGADRTVAVAASDCEKVAVVGPFESAGHGLEGDTTDGCSTSAEREPCPRCGGRATLFTTSALEEKIEELGDRASRESPARLVLIGRTDSLPIYTETYRSNFALAQGRANWVGRQFARADWTKSLHVMSIPGGPANPRDADSCDRVVEVHMCWAPPNVGSTGATTGTADAENDAAPSEGDDDSDGRQPS